MRKINIYLLLSLFALSFACQSATEGEITEGKNEDPLQAKSVDRTPQIDGFADDPCWSNAPWHPIDQLWLGDPVDEEDFSGRYKILWSEDSLYILAEITDDTLIDIHPDGLEYYWDDDCLEIFIDEDLSGGDHQYSHNAFAYHLALDYKVADIGPDSLAHFYDDHIRYRISRKEGDTYFWEVALAVFDDTYQDEAADNEPVKLRSGKKMGFAIAYCDNDHSAERENFIGSVFISGEDKNRGWIDAGVFETLELVD
ncbi:MAG: sugar-binding protein [Saprospiraceae bacterium]|nr:sugar-binding protein [Saprospiraceae bacterium]